MILSRHAKGSVEPSQSEDAGGQGAGVVASNPLIEERPFGRPMMTTNLNREVGFQRWRKAHPII